jgi:hypothetical protein
MIELRSSGIVGLVWWVSRCVAMTRVFPLQSYLHDLNNDSLSDADLAITTHVHLDFTLINPQSAPMPAPWSCRTIRYRMCSYP